MIRIVKEERNGTKEKECRAAVIPGNTGKCARTPPFPASAGGRVIRILPICHRTGYGIYNSFMLRTEHYILNCVFSNSLHYHRVYILFKSFFSLYRTNGL